MSVPNPAASTAFATSASGKSGTRGGVRATRASTGNGESLDAECVIRRLEEAGATLLALPACGWTTKLRSATIQPIQSAVEAYGWSGTQIQPAVPSSEQISKMDEAMDWLLEEEDSLGTSPILALRDGRKREVRRVAQALAF